VFRRKTGWFNGFKVHLVVNDCGELMGVVITTGNVGDRESVQTMTRKLFSKLFVNALNETGGNMSQAAEGLKMSLLGLKKAIKRLGIW
jgi:transcriptional regulator with GAF, ATPase, and Fis domain